MPTSYLHGVETLESEIGGSGDLGREVFRYCADRHCANWLANVLTACYSPADDAHFGKALPGFNIPKTLGLIRSIAGNTPVLVVNVFNPTTHTRR